MEADRERLQKEVKNLVESIAVGVPAQTIAPQIRERETKIAAIEKRLRTPRQAPPDVERLHTALMQRAEQWKADLRAEPKVARVLLRRLIGPLTLWEEAPEWCGWEAAKKANELLAGLAPIHDVASPAGVELMCRRNMAGILRPRKPWSRRA